jgi:hypothetical protein
VKFIQKILEKKNVKQHESENQHYDKKGLVKKGKANEVGIMQIQPTSNLGRGVAGSLTGIIKQVLKDEIENERIGRLHLMNLLGHTNNDISSTIMAWNRGLPTYREWDKAGRNFDKLPTKTKKYLEALKKYFPEPKAFVKKKEEITPAPVVKKETPAPVVEEPKISIDQAMKMSIPDYKYMLDIVSVPKREIFADMVKGILEHYINGFNDPKIIIKARNEILETLLEKPTPFENRPKRLS